MTKPYQRKIIGEIDSIMVFGQYDHEDGKPSVVGLRWRDWWIESDGASIWLPTTGDSVGHMLASDWARLKELAQIDVIDRLIEIGREWVKTPPIEPAVSE